MTTRIGFLIDMDGVIYRGSRPIEGAIEFIRRLQDVEAPFLFLTNNSQRSRRDICLRLLRMGLDVREDQVFTCAAATARFLARQRPGGTAYVIGEGGLLNALHEVGYAVDDQNPDYVVVGEGKSLSMEMLEKAVTFVNNGARLIATNMDLNCPTEHGSRPGCGAIVSVQCSSHLSTTVFHKTLPDFASRAVKLPSSCPTKTLPPPTATPRLVCPQQIAIACKGGISGL